LLSRGERGVCLATAIRGKNGPRCREKGKRESIGKYKEQRRGGNLCCVAGKESLITGRERNDGGGKAGKTEKKDKGRKRAPQVAEYGNGHFERKKNYAASRMSIEKAHNI